MAAYAAADVKLYVLSYDEPDAIADYAFGQDFKAALFAVDV